MNERFNAVDKQGQILERIASNDPPYRLKPAAPIQRDLLKPEPQLVPAQKAELPDEKSPFFQHSMAEPLPVSFDDQIKTNDNEGELSIPVEHTTAAHKLLMWPSIKQLIYPQEYDEDYVMRLEEERGLISVYGQGEISYTADDTQLPTEEAGWGKGRVNEDGVSKSQIGPISLDSEAEIDRSGLLQLDSQTARRYFTSYIDRMHKLHPFLDMNELSGKLETFIRCYCPRNTSTEQPSTFCRENQRGAKRKRSHEDLQGVRGGFAEPASAPSRPRVGRNIDNAIILLIFAIGSICETKSPLPGPIMDERVDYRHQYIPGPLPPLSQPAPINGTHAANGVLSPANSDSALPQASTSFYAAPIIPNTSQSFPSSAIDKTPKNLSRRTISNTRDEYGNVKNLQVIPGLALYGYATAILGHLQGGVELEHVQAGLLAGLYAGQLAHPFQSHGWICQAARACQVLVRQYVESNLLSLLIRANRKFSCRRRYERLEEGPVQDLYNFAYWTCLQLERWVPTGCKMIEYF